MKIVKAELENEVHTRFKVWCVQQGWSMGEAIERLILERTGGHKYPVRAPVEERKQVKEASKVVGGGLVEVQSPASDRKVSEPISNQKPSGKDNDHVEPDYPGQVPMAKCRKCGESFPVADMVTEPKSGKLFCGDCVENLKNGQA